MASEGPYALGILNLFFLLIGIVILMIVNVYVLVKWSHPDDKNQWWSAKLVVLSGMLVCVAAPPSPPLPAPPGGAPRNRPRPGRSS